MGGRGLVVETKCVSYFSYCVYRTTCVNDLWQEIAMFCTTVSDYSDCSLSMAVQKNSVHSLLAREQIKGVTGAPSPPFYSFLVHIHSGLSTPMAGLPLLSESSQTQRCVARISEVMLKFNQVDNEDQPWQTLCLCTSNQIKETLLFVIQSGIMTILMRLEGQFSSRATQIALLVFPLVSLYFVDSKVVMVHYLPTIRSSLAF